MVLNIVTSSLLLILTSVSSANAPVAFADRCPAHATRVSSGDENCYYAYCKTCKWSGEKYTGMSAESDASKDATKHMMDKDKEGESNHKAQPKSCGN
jgi:hypothetical protein